MVFDNFIYSFCESGICIDGYNGFGGFVDIPDEINGKKITEIGREAFRGRKDIYGVKFPKYIETIGDYAFCECRTLKEADIGRNLKEAGGHVFYNARSIEKMTLPGKVQFIGDGFVKNCEELKNITIITDGELSSQVIWLLSDISQKFCLNLINQKAMLIFPEYDYEYIANAPAMRFITVTHGSGVEYRKAIEKDGINFDTYDEAFSMAVREEADDMLTEIAVMRLMHPYLLKETYFENYKNFISRNIGYVIRYAAKKEGIEILEMIDKNNIFTEDNMKSALNASSHIKRADFSAYLMDIKFKNFGRKKKVFEL
ncbi:MAG: leucine-rich repeat domain-containing protein [Clostridia bacterium]|jgi:hypothetical protein|nr:leucine-rich repeat domain-containing protein [Clostridia bacterium]